MVIREARSHPMKAITGYNITKNPKRLKQKILWFCSGMKRESKFTIKAIIRVTIFSKGQTGTFVNINRKKFVSKMSYSLKNGPHFKLVSVFLIFAAKKKCFLKK